jgi:secretion/DNA translocation related CpaE-like protein
MAARTALSSTERPLLVTDDAHLLDEVLNLAADAGVDIDVAPDPVAARARYRSAPFVLVGAELAEACARADLTRSDGVIMVAAPDRPEPPWDAAERLGAHHVAVLPAAASWLRNQFATLTGDCASGQVVAVIGGRGGAGASVLAAGLAITASRSGLRTLLIDGDPLGGGLDLLLGLEGMEGLRWPDLADTAGSVSAPALVEALPRRGELAVLSCERTDGSTLSTDAMATAINTGRRGSDLVVVDLPRRFDDVTVTAIGSADRVLLVVPAELRACAAAARVASTLLMLSESVAVVVRGPAPGHLKAREVASALGLPLAGMLRSEPAMARDVEQGRPPAGNGVGPLANLCRQMLAQLGCAERAAAA